MASASAISSISGRASRDSLAIRTINLSSAGPIVEAKDASHTIRDGIQQALAYAEMLDVPFAFSSNGSGFLFHDRTAASGVIERELALSEFPSPAELWSRYQSWKGLPADTAPLLSQDYHPGIRIDFDKDLGWRPTAGKTDKHGQLVEDRIYNRSDINKTLVLEQRDVLVAERITALLTATDRYAKTIVFCEDIDHAARMRQALLNANADLAAKNPKYVVQITGDNEEGKRELDNFIDPEKPYPVIATTSRLMNTGVDAQTCKLIVLDRTINSMTEFKQIIGRGTRINEDYDKLWFTILDFKRATELFADPAFDGEPVVIYEPQPDEPIAPPDDPGIPEDHPIDLIPEQDEAGQPRIKYVIGDVPVYVAREQVQYYGPDGRLITESLRDYTRIVVTRRFTSLDDFLQTWSAADKKQAVISELEAQGVFFDELAREVGKDLDPFDLVAHIAFGQKPLTRRERALNVKKRNVFGKYGATARQVLDALLDKYADEGIADIEQGEVLRLAPLDRIGSPLELIRAFGGKAEYQQALRELERSLYQ